MKLVILLSVPLVLFSCAKGPGDGGQAAIKGRVFAVNYDKTLTVAVDSGYLGGQKVYINYGADEIALGGAGGPLGAQNVTGLESRSSAVDDNQDTDYDGTFEFKYLRKGKYKVFAYSLKLSPSSLSVPVAQEVEITGSGQTITLPDFRINTQKN